MSISCAVIDDEALGRQIIREYLQPHTDIEVKIDEGDPQKAYELILVHQPQLLFLDIQMPELTGFELLTQLSPDRLLPAPTVIFCTAYDEYAIKAFEANAVDYLLKPFDQNRFDRALEKARRHLQNVQAEPQLAQLLSYLQKNPQTSPQRIAVRKGNHLIMVQVNDILWLEALEDYVRIHTLKTEYLMSQRLGDMARQFDSQRFLRIHRSAIVNLDWIKEIHPWSSGRYLLVLKNGVELETSKSGAKVVKEVLL